MNPTKSKDFTAASAIVLIVLLAVGAYFFARWQDPSTSTATASVASPLVFASGPAVFYSQDTRNAITSVSTHAIYRRAVSGSQVLITTLGDEDSTHGLSFLVSPDGNTLIANYGDHLYSIDTHTGTKTPIYTAAYSITSDVAISQDSKTVFNFDAQYNNDLSQPQQYVAESYDLTTNKLTKLGTGTYTIGTGFSIGNWVTSHVIDFDESTYDYTGEYWQYDLQTNTFTDTGVAIHPDTYLTPDNTHLADGSPYDQSDQLTSCGPFSVSGSTYDYTTAAGTKLSSFGVTGKQVKVLAFSPDLTQVLISTSDIPATNAACDGTETNLAYATINVTGTSLQSVPDYTTVMKKWGVPVPATVVIGSSTNGSLSSPTSLLYGDTTLTTADLPSSTEWTVIGTTN